MDIKKKQWGEQDGKIIWLYSLTSKAIEVEITNYGCTIMAIRVTDKALNRKNVVLGYSTVEELVADKYYMGSIVGRYAGRISKSSFEIDGKEYHLPANAGTSGNHLHGGPEGFNKIFFEELSRDCGEDSACITFHATSDDGDQGYPGKVDLRFTITLNSANEIMFSYNAKPDRPTHINLTHHLYYNLRGTGPATEQHLAIDAGYIVETREDYIPSGRIIKSSGYADFLSSRPVPPDNDYNECYVLNKPGITETAARLTDPASGVTIELATTCPAIIFYSGQFLGSPFYPKQGICLEAQYFPDAPNHVQFPSTLCSPEKVFSEHTKLKFTNIK